MSGSRAEMKVIDGPTLRSVVAGAGTVLQRHVAALNAVNVFPVPDGDTGTNMHLTLRAGLEELDRTRGERLSDVAQALAQGTLMGARGNSGVILSQILRGFAAGLGGLEQADGPALAGALSQAATAARGALSEPVEGTILTVAREAAEALAEPPVDAADALAQAVAAAHDAVARTPELLPVLKEAGVVDAGGLGLAIILEGMLRSLRGESLDVNLAPDVVVEAEWKSEAASLHNGATGETGYCTEFIVRGDALDPAPAREQLDAMGSSLLVVGGGEVLRVHLHTPRPDDALAYGRTLGELSQVKVDNLRSQVQRFVSDLPAPEATPAGIAIVAVAAGEGIEAAFRGVGVTRIVRSGQTMNPSAGEILEAIESCAADDVAVLPNNKNVIASAEQAATQSTKHVRVVPSRSIPQGIAAALSLDPELTFEENVAAMEQARGGIRSAEITRAVRGTTMEGRKIAVGQAIGLVDGSLRVVADDIESAVQQCVEEMRSDGLTLLTLYAGTDTTQEDAEALATRLRGRYPEWEVELVLGDQPHYPYLISLE
ncbi:MAG: DAK2 domain-containing protein [Dehalococcoidia bacterium]